MALRHKSQLIRLRQPSGVLRMLSIDHISHARHRTAVRQQCGEGDFTVDGRDLFPLAQIGESFSAPLGGYPESGSTTGAAAIEAKHEARFFRGAPVDMGEDAKRSMITADESRLALFKFKAGTPHQRPIAEYPEIPFFAHFSPISSPDSCKSPVVWNLTGQSE